MGLHLDWMPGFLGCPLKDGTKVLARGTRRLEERAATNSWWSFGGRIIPLTKAWLSPLKKGDDLSQVYLLDMRKLLLGEFLIMPSVQALQESCLPAVQAKFCVSRSDILYQLWVRRGLRAS